MVPAVPCDAPSFACRSEDRQPAGPDWAGGALAAGLVAATAWPVAGTVVVTVLVGVAAGAVVPHAVINPEAPATAESAPIRRAAVAIVFISPSLASARDALNPCHL